MKTKDKNKVIMMITGAIFIFFTGFPHVWSVYTPYVIRQTGWSQGQASMCFYLSLASFVIGNIIGGRIQDRKNPRLVIIAGGAVFAAGILASSACVTPSPLGMYMTYGIMQGFGQGMIYITILTTAQKWFPDNKGTASGVIVTANGLCGLIMAPLSRRLLAAFGVRNTLFAVGAAVTAAWILSCIGFAVPEETETNVISQEDMSISSKQYTPEEMVKTKAYYLLAFAMMCSLISYFLVSPLSQTWQISLGIPETAAVSAVMIGSVVNAFARLVLPSAGDKIGRSICIKTVIALQIITMIVLTAGSGYTVTAAIIVLYGCYGGIMGSYPSFTNSIFGMRNAGANYGLVMMGMIAASLGAPGISGVLAGTSGNYRQVFAAGIVFGIIGLISIILLDREISPKKGEEKNGISNNERTAEACAAGK